MTSLMGTEAYKPEIPAATPEGQLADLMAECYADPLKFVLMVFPWGEEGTPLAGFTGPGKWQIKLLESMGADIEERGFNGRDAVKPIQYSVASGHGIGKSTMVAWLILWLMSTRAYCRGVLTANTGGQLKTKTWVEISKWYNMCLTKHWFRMTHGQELSLRHVEHELWRLDAVPWREEKPDAFAGLHNASSTGFFIFDEASGIPNKIWETRLGGLTDGESITIDFGNPIRNSGMFYENMVGRFKHNYKKLFVDSRDVEITNKAYLEDLIRDYGIDSDYIKVRVLGQFPSAGSAQFIPMSYVDNCMGLEVQTYDTDPVIVGVDVADTGEDSSVIVIRRGRDVVTGSIELDNKNRSYPAWQTFAQIDPMELADKIVDTCVAVNYDYLCIDAGGVGSGVVSRCEQLGLRVERIMSGAGASNDEAYANKRAEMWGNMRDNLQYGIALPDREDLRGQLCSLEFGVNNRRQILLEKKVDLKKRGLPSPDMADALALTYAYTYDQKRSGYSGGGKHDSGMNWMPSDDNEYGL